MSDRLDRLFPSTDHRLTYGPFRFSASKSRLDRFPISSSAESVSDHWVKNCLSAKNGQEGGGQRQNRLSALPAPQDQEDSPDVITASDTNYGRPARTVILSTVRRLEAREEKKVKNPSSRTQQGSISSSPEIERFLREIRDQVQVLSIQITHRSIPDLQFSSISGESSFFEDYSDMFI
uniref:Uncharacterized protein n=1 Tax=Solanum tuberosum TaxID=4113 RepID=M1DMD1_SOLTU